MLRNQRVQIKKAGSNLCNTLTNNKTLSIIFNLNNCNLIITNKTDVFFYKRLLMTKDM